MPRTRTTYQSPPTLQKLAAKRLAEKRKSATLRFAKYRDNPVGFAREVLNLEVWSRQAEILEAIRDHMNVAVRSGQKIGKSTAAVAIALWWVCTRPMGRVVMTSSCDDQVRNVLWRELARIYDPPAVRTRIGGTRQLDPRTGLRFPDGREIIGFSTKKPENMAGLSGPEMLFIADEASGIDDAIFEAIEGNRAGGAPLIMFSNPTKTSGKFYAAFHQGREFWQCIHVSSEEAVEARIRGLASRSYVEQRKREWGVDSAIYQVRIEGNFAVANDNAVVGLAALEEATKRWADTPGDGRLSLGVDVARFGDDESVICPRRGLKIFEAIVHRSMDGAELAGAVLAAVRELRNENEVPLVKVDAIGVGASVVDHLKPAHRRREIELVEINSSRSADDDDEFYNLRTQLHFAVAQWISDGGAINDNDPKLEAEIVAPIYGFDPRGRRKVESKDDIKKRLGRSPDRADAMALAIYDGPASGRSTGKREKALQTYESPMGGM